MIYFLQPVAGGPIKIGHSIDVEARRKQLEAHYRQPLALLATMPGGREEERTWHERFAHLRFGRTEQFRPAPELMEAIGRPLLVGANPDTVEVMPAMVEEKTKPVRLDLTEAEHKELRAIAGIVGQSMANYAREAVVKVVREDLARRGIKL